MNVDRVLAAVRSRAFLTVVLSTSVLTAAFVGIAAAWEGRLLGGLTSRLPFYLLAFAVGFIFALWRLDAPDRDGATILVAVSGFGLVTALVVAFAVEGAWYAAHHPWQVLDPGLLVLFTAAAIICTGLGIWGVRHWREFTSATRPADVAVDDGGD